MKYRAKITNIPVWTSQYVKESKYPRVRDEKDIYVEVDDEDTAEAIEHLNQLRGEERKTKAHILTMLRK